MHQTTKIRQSQATSGIVLLQNYTNLLTSTEDEMNG
jgi:hypothetical protein